MYSEEAIKHFHNPHNYGKIKNPSAIGDIGNIRCGDIMKLYIKVSKKEIIEDIIRISYCFKDCHPLNSYSMDQYLT